MKIYIVEAGFDYEGEEVMSCFSTLEAAKEYARKHATGDDTTVREWELDKVNEPSLKAASKLVFWLKRVNWREDIYEEQEIKNNDR